MLVLGSLMLGRQRIMPLHLADDGQAVNRMAAAGGGHRPKGRHPAQLLAPERRVLRRDGVFLFLHSVSSFSGSFFLYPVKSSRRLCAAPYYSTPPEPAQFARGFVFKLFKNSRKKAAPPAAFSQYPRVASRLSSWRTYWSRTE